MRVSIVNVWVGVVVVAAALLLPACINMEEVMLAKRQAMSLREELAAEAGRLEELLGTLPADDPARGAVQAQLERTRALARGVEVTLEKVEEVLAEVEEPSDPISALVGAVAPWVPEPARTPLVLGGALAATLVRARRLRQGISSFVQGLDQAMQEDEAFAQKFKEHAERIRASHTALAAKVVDEVVSRRMKAAA